MSGDDFFPTAFRALTGNRPFPWQERLYALLSRGDLPDSCDIPTGLGKTAVIPIWLIALADRNHAVPRRLVYVVNRRTVVDQATTEAEKIRAKLMHPEGDDAPPEIEAARRRLREALEGLAADPKSGPLAISTLRGQFADNREWSADPSQPAIIVGTVDMIGSRLLFSGYRAGFKTKPLHAGFLGQDALLVHDEAHLEPAFQTLIEAIVREQADEHETFATPLGAGMRLKVLELTATPRGGEPLRLDPQTDYKDAVVKKRIGAKKSISLEPYVDEKNLPDLLADRALTYRESGRAVLVFATTVETVEKVAARLEKECPGQVERLTGTLRGKERDELMTKSVFKRFLPAAEAGGGSVYLVCTSAGEVGVNISSDHMACDLSTFESMAQRLGRVNRFGDRADTRVDVFHPREFESGKEIESRKQKTLRLLRGLDGDGSPDALGKLDPEERRAAFSPEPIFLRTTDILYDAWSLTSVREKLPGRPPVEPYLHGLPEWEPPVTQVAWREEVGIIVDALRDRYRPEDLLADYPLKPHELLRDRSERVFKHLTTLALAGKNADAPAWLVDEDGTVQGDLKLKDLADKDWKDRIHGKTVLLPPSVGGLNGGLLDGASTMADDVADEWFYEDHEKTLKRRSRVWDGDPKPEGMRLVRGKIDTKLDQGEDGEDEPPAADEISGDDAEPGTVDQCRERELINKRFWRWYATPRSADDDQSRTGLRPVSCRDHTRDVVDNARRIVENLSIPEEIKAAVILAAEYHDLGKSRPVWQRSIGNFDQKKCLAKSDGSMMTTALTGYRHEFGSLLDAERELEVRKLDGDARDLVLHLIAAHHGRGRPHFPEKESFDPERSSDDAGRVAAEVPQRFARLQRRYGRWGLAYLESLLRAADYAASARPSTTAEEGS